MRRPSPRGPSCESSFRIKEVARTGLLHCPIRSGMIAAAALDGRGRAFCVLSKIIISYRRADADVFAGRVRDRIASSYGEDSVFIDVDNIPFGKDFRFHIQEVMAKANAVLVIIGPKWLGLGRAGHSRIMDATDPCRIEVETALANNIPTFPVLVGRTAMPKPDQLPESLKDFAFINAAAVDTGRDFHRDLTRVLAALNDAMQVPVTAVEQTEVADEISAERLVSPAISITADRTRAPFAPAGTNAITEGAVVAGSEPSLVQPVSIAAEIRRTRGGVGSKAAIAVLSAAVVLAGLGWLLLPGNKSAVPTQSAGTLSPGPPPTPDGAVFEPAAVPGTTAPAVIDPGAAVVAAFFDALGRGDGVAAAALIIPEKRKDNYDPQRMTQTYSKFVSRLHLTGVVASGPHTYQATYTYQTSPSNSVCATTATVTVTERAGQYFIQTIRASC